MPIIVDKDGVIVAGHTRLKAAEKLGLDEVPVIVADDLTPEQDESVATWEPSWDRPRLKRNELIQLE